MSKQHSFRPAFTPLYLIGSYEETSVGDEPKNAEVRSV
jgi:hypothetical protein